jgi:hypothetical protein
MKVTRYGIIAVAIACSVGTILFLYINMRDGTINVHPVIFQIFEYITMGIFAAAIFTTLLWLFLIIRETYAELNSNQSGD